MINHGRTARVCRRGPGPVITGSIFPSPAAFPRDAEKKPRHQWAEVLVLSQVSIIDTRHNHYSWCVAVAELLMMQCMSGCACRVSLTTVWREEEEQKRGSGGGCWEIGPSSTYWWFFLRKHPTALTLMWLVRQIFKTHCSHCRYFQIKICLFILNVKQCFKVNSQCQFYSYSTTLSS